MFARGVQKTGVIRINPAVQIHQCEDEQKNECFVLMHPLRKDDVFPADLSKEQMVDLFFPKTTSDMAKSLSNVTSAFYGVMLESTGKVVGMENINPISQDFFYKLGTVKTQLTRADVGDRYTLPADARGVVIMLVSAIYNASPEYTFNIKKFSEDACEIELTGEDRYLRITKKLGISEHLQWPVLHRFMQGINDELQAGTDIKSEMLKAEDNGDCHERYTITRKR
jgi:hypothetical protein